MFNSYNTELALTNYVNIRIRILQKTFKNFA